MFLARRIKRRAPCPAPSQRPPPVRSGLYAEPHAAPDVRARELRRTYWRPIDSEITGESYAGVHLKYPKAWWRDVPERALTTPFDEYDKGLNQYGVKVGTTLEF